MQVIVRGAVREGKSTIAKLIVEALKLASFDVDLVDDGGGFDFNSLEGNWQNRQACFRENVGVIEVVTEQERRSVEPPFTKPRPAAAKHLKTPGLRVKKSGPKARTASRVR